jgi:hypothetical protein
MSIAILIGIYPTDARAIVKSNVPITPERSETEKSVHTSFLEITASFHFFQIKGKRRIHPRRCSKKIRVGAGSPYSERRSTPSIAQRKAAITMRRGHIHIRKNTYILINKHM